MMIDTDKRGCKELLLQRMFLAVVTSVTLQSLLVCCFVLLANLSVDYAYWLRTTWTIVTSLRMWSYLAVLATLTFLQSFLCGKTYLQTRPYYKSRFARLYATLTIQNLFLGTSYVVIGGVLVWLHLSLVGGRYSTITADCSIVYGACLVEEHYFLLLGGLWSGLYLTVRTNEIAGRYFRFPVIAQSKFSRWRRRICATLPSLMASSIWSTLYYMTGYYFLGSYCRAALLSVFSARMEVEPLDTVSNLLNLRLMSYLWFHQFVFVLIISNTYLLFEVYSTEWIRLKFDSSGVYSTNDSEVTLIDALSMNKIPIMQYLGYLDLITLAQKEQPRRRMLFTLSQPGGHPYNWNCVVQKCLDLLRRFSSDLNAIFIKPQDYTYCYSAKTLPITAVSTPRKDYAYHMRKLVPDLAQSSLTAGTETEEIACSGWSIQRSIKQKRDAFVAHLLSKPLINYIFSEQDDNKIRHILLNGQLIIWAAEAVSSLSVFSLNEDSYGIVQKDVPSIINVLLSVKQALDKLQKSAILARKIQADDKLTRELFTSLRSAIKRSLYRIITNFEPYVSDLFLEPVKVEQLQGFLNYKE